MMSPQSLYTVEQIADMSGQSAVTVRQHCRRGLFPGAVKLGKTWIIPHTGWIEYRPPMMGSPQWRRVRQNKQTSKHPLTRKGKKR